MHGNSQKNRKNLFVQIERHLHQVWRRNYVKSWYVAPPYYPVQFANPCHRRDAQTPANLNTTTVLWPHEYYIQR